MLEQSNLNSWTEVDSIQVTNLLFGVMTIGDDVYGLQNGPNCVDKYDRSISLK